MTAMLVLLTLHFIGDFWFQTNRMAMEKSKDWGMLAIHVVTYTSVMVIGVSSYLSVTTGRDPMVIVPFAVVTFALHFLTDAVTSRVTSKLWFMKLTAAGEKWREIGPGVASKETAYYVDDTGTRHWFFVMIGFDQLLHVYALAATWWWVTR